MAIRKALRDRDEVIPWYFGRTYYDFEEDVTIAHIIPLNIIIKLWREVLFSLRKGLFKSNFEILIRKVFSQGYQKGVNDEKLLMDLDKTDIDFIVNSIIDNIFFDSEFDNIEVYNKLQRLWNQLPLEIRQAIFRKNSQYICDSLDIGDDKENVE